MRLFIEDIKGCVEAYDNVQKVSIKKIDNKNNLEIKYNLQKEVEYIPLSNIKLCFLIDTETMQEYFRYEK